MRASPTSRVAAGRGGCTAAIQLRSRLLHLAPAAAAIAAVALLSGGAGGPAAASSPVHGPTTGPPYGPGHVEILRLPSGDADHTVRDVWVYRPPHADRPEVPVVYFLHGYPGNERNGDSVNLAGVLDRARAATGRNFVVVVPDGNSAIHPDTEWADSVDGKVRLEQFVTSGLVRAVEGRHVRDRAHRAIAGFSMGGYGAMNLGLRHSDLYGQVAAVAGYFHPDDPDSMGGGQDGWARANSPDRLLANAHRTRLLLIDAAAERDPLIKGEARRFVRLARSDGLRPTLVVARGGHNWSMVAGQVGRITGFFDAGWPRHHGPGGRRPEFLR
ncbi:MAG TPA: alpha/beta hydrolase-fold protein [Acidimicrobiia bacterium]|nr:alpha/beta hydrolase-fold protein [Acidimicrobiia bacterium]